MITTRNGTLMLLLAAALPAGRLLAQDDDHEGRPTSETLRPVSEKAHPYPQGWASVGFGAGEEAYRYSGAAQLYSPTVTAPMFNATLGARLNPMFDLGLEAYGWVNGEQQGTMTLGGFQIITRLHPLGRWMYLKGGAGLATTNYWDASYCGCSGGPTYVGFAYNVGAGLELPMGKNVALEPQVNLYYQSYSGRSFPAYTERILHIGLGISFGFKS